MENQSAILVTGGSGMVGSALIRELARRGFTNIYAPNRGELDLLDSRAVMQAFERFKPDYVFLLAARVGGIQANISDPIGFLNHNLIINQNTFAACERYQPKKSLFLGSSCIYPRECPQPMKEEYLLTGPLEPTNEGYALSKIVGLRLAQYLHKQKDLLTVCPMPCNLYGTGDHFDLDKAHVLSSLVRRFVDAEYGKAESVTLWGDGSARREFLHVDDLIRSIFFFMEKVESSEIINVGCGYDVTIRELAESIKQAVGYDGDILWDTSKPNGMPKKCLDITKLQSMGFEPSLVDLQSGIRRVVQEYKTLLLR